MKVCLVRLQKDLADFYTFSDMCMCKKHISCLPKFHTFSVSKAKCLPDCVIKFITNNRNIKIQCKADPYFDKVFKLVTLISGDPYKPDLSRE